MCVYGYSQSPCISKKEPSSPTISTEELVITLETGPHKNRDVTTCDIFGAYSNTNMEEFTTLKTEGNMVDLMVQSIPKKCEHFMQSENKKVLIS